LNSKGGRGLQKKGKKPKVRELGTGSTQAGRKEKIRPKKKKRG